MNPTASKPNTANVLNAFSMDSFGPGLEKLFSNFGHGIGKVGGAIGDVASGAAEEVKHLVNPQKAQASTAPAIPKIPVGRQYQNYLEKAKNGIDGSFKTGGDVKKTGNYKLHKGERVLNPREAALLKGYQNKNYNRSESIAEFKKTGFFKTKDTGAGHDMGYNWAKQNSIDYKDRKRKYSRNSPSFDEGVYAYKHDSRQEALKNRMK